MKMTKISLALAMLGLSAVAFAGMPGNQVVAPAGVNLIAPDSVGVWSIGLEAMYVQPTNNNFNYGQLNTSSTGSTYTSRKNQNVGDNWQWGGTVDLTYMFPGQSRDVKLAWTHLFSSTDSHTNNVGTNQTFAPSFYHSADLGGPNIGSLGLGLLGGGGVNGNYVGGGTAHGSTETNYDAVDLVFGQWIKIGDRLDLHPFGGLRWAQVDTTDKASYLQNGIDDSLAPDVVSAASYNKLTSNFDGIGPRAGFDTAVHLGSGFSIVGTFAGSLLIGNLDANIKHTGTTYDATGAVVTTTSDKVNGNNNGTVVVPELDARLGLDYMYAFTTSTSMNVQLGYQVVNYFDVTEADFQGTAGAGGSGAVPNTTANRQDWGYQGPYLRLQLNIA